MPDPKRPRRFTEEFRRQIVELCLAGKPRGEIQAGYDLSSSTISRWTKNYESAGATTDAAARTPGEERMLELERENKRLKMEVDVLKQAAPTFAQRQGSSARTPAGTPYQRSATYSAFPGRPTAGCSRTRRPSPRRTP